MPYEVDGPLLCHVWTGRTANGAPIVRDSHGCTTVRRREWERAHGPIPEGMIVMPVCRNALCVKVEHLACVTWSEWNYRTARSKLDPRRAALAMGLRRTGMSRRQVALHFGVDPETIHAVENGTHWTQRKAA